ncbi:hypothetical protein T440DRAFT_246701 [Plenodomus tracheiphilus IPT5]|uniref:Protein kinase domain-containing protein n=1 Tax=Plenodomus tracheiphilus IPT5 TaxID=1408161 RepID=A0A6A7ASA2_9PLEO|nr:hypothetical protein T440DRAFT_246701 [Plenodomus tracheiphilus IPT5]
MSRSSSAEVASGLPSPPGTPTLKPTNPYYLNAVLTAKRHEPPPPFGGLYRAKQVPFLPTSTHVDPLEWCISHPPTPGTTSTEDIHTFTITGIIRTGDNCGAQVVHIDSDLIAKIYDPVYYEYHGSSTTQRQVDISVAADSEYSRETAAYVELKDSDAQGTIMPKYYGSWTTTVSHRVGDGAVEREVRMILLESVPGIQMIYLDPGGLTKEERENIMMKLIEADYDLRHLGIEHNDVAPRNVIISRASSYINPKLRVTLIDYGSSYVSRILWGEAPLWCRHNPAFDWVTAEQWSSWGWLPYDEEERIDWVWSVWGDGRDGKYIKVERDPDNPHGGPEEPNFVDSEEEGRSDVLEPVALDQPPILETADEDTSEVHAMQF